MRPTLHSEFENHTDYLLQEFKIEQTRIRVTGADLREWTVSTHNTNTNLVEVSLDLIHSICRHSCAWSLSVFYKSTAAAILSLELLLLLRYSQGCLLWLRFHTDMIRFLLWQYVEILLMMILYTLNCADFWLTDNMIKSWLVSCLKWQKYMCSDSSCHIEQVLFSHWSESLVAHLIN